MAIFNGMNISASGMTAQTMRMDTIAQNLANIDTTRGEDGKVYRRKTVVFAEKNKDAFGTALAMQQARRATTVNGQGVKVTAIAEDHVTALK
jgi:flagellar basal-body rod protein FlgC